MMHHRVLAKIYNLIYSVPRTLQLTVTSWEPIWVPIQSLMTTKSFYIYVHITFTICVPLMCYNDYYMICTWRILIPLKKTSWRVVKVSLCTWSRRPRRVSTLIVLNRQASVKYYYNYNQLKWTVLYQCLLKRMLHRYNSCSITII